MAGKREAPALAPLPEHELIKIDDYIRVSCIICGIKTMVHVTCEEGQRFVLFECTKCGRKKVGKR